MNEISFFKENTMKKIVTLLLTLALCVSACASLASCAKKNESTEHTPASEHTYLSVWSTNATHHWHACSAKGCDQIKDKSEHTWDEGRIIAEPTPAKSGEIKYTCTECERTKVEPIPFAGFTADSWAKMIAKDNFSNVTILQSYTIKTFSGDELLSTTDYNSTIKFTADKATEVGTSVIGDEVRETNFSYAGEERNECLADFHTLFSCFAGDFSKFKYADGKMTAENFSVDYDGDVLDVESVSISFTSSGKIERLICVFTSDFNEGEGSHTVHNQSQLIFTEYGTTVIE